MDFLLNEEQRAVQKLTFDFAQNEIAPFAREHDEQGKINWDALKKMGKLNCHLRHSSRKSNGRHRWVFPIAVIGGPPSCAGPAAGGCAWHTMCRQV